MVWGVYHGKNSEVRGFNEEVESNDRVHLKTEKNERAR